MKISNLSKLVGAGVIAASLAIVPLTVPANAQSDTSGTSGTSGTYSQPSGNVATENDNDFDWGWLGLLGLAGLAGLAGKKRHETVHTQQVHNDPDVVVRRGSDYR
jgi:MYXO-CTERM domain-containing protein